jgi:hypothetical protein
MITKQNLYKLFYIFLHLLIWTLIPTFSNQNLPLDTIEALAWGSNLDWGYNKHPPLSALIANTFYFLFGSNDWAYYLLSQICVIVSFLFVWKFAENFFLNKIYIILSLLTLETIVFFNYTTPEFNVYVCQLPLKAAAVYYFWKSINSTNLYNWLATGIFCALGILTHYSFIFLIVSLFVFFIFFVQKNKKQINNFLISLFIFLLILFPHFMWLVDNNFQTINYAFDRAGIEEKDLIKHLINPVKFLLKQIGMLSLFVLIFLSIISIKKLRKINFKTNDKKKLFLLIINLLPILIIFIVSFISGAKIRTMWMSTFYLFFGVLFFYFFQKIIDLKKIKGFLFIFIFLFLLSPITYFYISISNDLKRTDYPGREIAALVQDKWNDNFVNEIKIVIGDEWSAGNLSYHLYSRPIWVNDLKNKTSNITENQGVIYVGNPNILKKICPGVFGIIKPVGYCMIGKR